MKPDFPRVSPRHWRLSPSISAVRKRNLLSGRSFASIIRQILKQAVIHNHKTETIEKFRGYFRPVITLRVNSVTVDQFHNSSSGYRAQYFRSVSNGERANSFVINTLVPRVVGLLRLNPKRTCPLRWVEKSLRGSQAKAWIYQGGGLRRVKNSDRNLAVKRWQNQSTKDKKRVWASLTPMNETRIELKGAPISLDGRYLTRKLKPQRGNTIHQYGYT